jgi:hypothetical protein
MHISVTRLKLRSPFYLFGFVREAKRSIAQAEATPGFQSGALLVDQWFTFWTATAWDSPDAMRAFRNSGAHGAVMPKLLDWCNEASVVALEAPALPDWSAIYDAMVERGRSSKVRHPSRKHLAGIIDPMRPWAPSRLLKKRSAT